ncbi:hypothetical protein GCM10010919_31890 [Alishewanella longhuensis]|uniref:Aminoglycoside phosphotransferase domain-containing protein n=1 Tax=Alishewanella longhuensis TaxID=1091037 RepID=A0ABQ3L1Y6_9ALTE|nr:hypothetical protein GCM10010919_31890 [Alishewanella longhuensis]
MEVKPLASGESNLNYYVRTERGEYVLRRYPLDTLGVCRQQELRCQHAAAAVGLAPAPLCLNNHQQLLISEYVTGGKPLTLTPERLLLLASTLAELHALKVQTPIMQVSQYLRQLMHNSQMPALEPAASLFNALQQNAHQFEAQPSDLVLCHMDLHQGNLLWAAGRIWLLDFEYTQLTDSSFDLAAISLHFQLSEQQEQQMLTHYHAKRRFADNQSALRYQQSLHSRLKLAKVLYSGFCWLWYQAAPDYQDAAQQWRHKLAELLLL